MSGPPRRGDEMTMWSPPLLIKDIRELALGSGSAVRGAPTITSGTIRPTLLIVGPPYSAVIVSGDTIFEQRLVAAPTATVRSSPRRPCLRRNAAGWPCRRQPVMTDQFGDYRQGVRGDTNR